LCAHERGFSAKMTRFFKETELPLYMTVEQVADLLQVCPETVARRARNKTLPTVPGLRCHRFPRDEVLQVLRKRDILRGPR
jgi:excisionase family DNA binding protein